MNNVEGWLSKKEGDALYKLASEAGGVIVEIGSYKGKSTIQLALGSKNGCREKIYAVDPHTGSQEHQKKGQVWTFDEFIRNISNARVDDIIEPLVMTSQQAVSRFEDNSISLIFIDGSHEYEDVKNDFFSWYPKIKEGGIMAFHDSLAWQGVKKVVKENIYKSRNFKNTRLVESITIAKKVRKNNIFDIIKGRYILLINDICHFFQELYLPRPIRMIGRKIVEIIQ